MVNSAANLAECARNPRADEDPYGNWRTASDGHDELRVFCPECFRQKFLYSSLVEVRTPGELVESHVHGGSSRHLMSAYYRTPDAYALVAQLRDEQEKGLGNESNYVFTSLTGRPLGRDRLSKRGVLGAAKRARLGQYRVR